jgi:hypothetical protein
MERENTKNRYEIFEEELMNIIERDTNPGAICFAISQDNDLFTLSIYYQKTYYLSRSNMCSIQDVKMAYIKHIMYSICIKKYGYVPVAKTSNNFSIPHFPHSSNIKYFAAENRHLRDHKNAIYHISLMKPEVISYYVGSDERYMRFGRCKIIFDSKSYQAFINFLKNNGRFDILLKMEI